MACFGAAALFLTKKNRKFFRENIDPTGVFAYNRGMSISKRWILRIVLTAVCAFAVGFILYNSLQPAVQSAQQSGRVVALIQRAVAVVAPNSSIANATGDAYQRLHEAVRTLAHFSEYALLGALAAWCYRSYTSKKLWLGVTSGGVVLMAVLDECVQTFSAGRGAQFLDVTLDILGGGVGVAFALLTVWLVGKWIQKRRAHETR
jgi:VanZ family protein